MMQDGELTVGESINARFEETLFSTNSNPEGSGLAIQCLKCAKVLIHGTCFEDLQGKSGAAVKFDKSCKVFLKQVTF